MRPRFRASSDSGMKCAWRCSPCNGWPCSSFTTRRAGQRVAGDAGRLGVDGTDGERGCARVHRGVFSHSRSWTKRHLTATDGTALLDGIALPDGKMLLAGIPVKNHLPVKPHLPVKRCLPARFYRESRNARSARRGVYDGAMRRVLKFSGIVRNTAAGSTVAP